MKPGQPGQSRPLCYKARQLARWRAFCYRPTVKTRLPLLVVLGAVLASGQADEIVTLKYKEAYAWDQKEPTPVRYVLREFEAAQVLQIRTNYHNTTALYVSAEVMGSRYGFRQSDWIPGPCVVEFGAGEVPWNQAEQSGFAVLRVTGQTSEQSVKKLQVQRSTNLGSWRTIGSAAVADDATNAFYRVKID